MSMRKFLALIALLLCLVAPLRAEEPNQPIIEEEDWTNVQPAVDPSLDGHKPALTWWCGPYAEEVGWAVQVANRWNQLHPDQPVELRSLPPRKLAEDVFREAIAAGNTPDITNFLFPTNAHEFAAKGALVPLDSVPGMLDYLKARCGANADVPFRSPDGKLYQFPWKGNPLMMQYNAALFRRYNLRPPRTYSEFLQSARVLQAASRAEKRALYLWAPNPANQFWQRYYDFYPLYLAASGGKSLLTPDGKAAFDNPAGVQVMAFLRDLYQQGLAPEQNVFPDDLDQVRAFSDGNLGMMLTGPWNIMQVRDQAGEEFQFDFAQLPVPDGSQPSEPVFSYGNYRNFGMFSTCKDQALAAEFIRFATSRESDLGFLYSALQLPVRDDLEEEPLFVLALQQSPAPLLKFAVQGRWEQPVGNVADFNQVLQILSDELIACAVQNKKTPEQAVHDAARRVDAPR